MTSTERLRALLDERGIEWRSGLEGVTFVGDWCFVEYDDGKIAATCEPVLTPEQAINATVGPKITEDTSDGWHSFKDLYHHRALLFSVIVHNYRDMCWKSKKHDDGTELGWNFIVGIDTPWGQASYHYGMEYWDMFDCKVLERAPEYDGYTPEQSVERIAKLVELDAATVGKRSCASCPEMDSPDSYISHLQAALKWHDEHVPIPTNPIGTCVVLQGKKPPEEVLFIRDEGGVTHYLPEETCHYDPDDAGFTWWDENDVEHYEEYSASDECWSASCDKCGHTMMVGDEGWFDGWDEITEWTEEDGSEHKGYVLKPRFKYCPNCGRRVIKEEAE